ncbi:MAG: o-succinylbenzoate synthase [Thaumarchaeota archaeon]|nr:o-succinylbenzoate synthase [Nitrososphaerota archaeon]
MSLTIRHVRLPFLAPFTTSFGTEAERNALILLLDSDGVKAQAECVASVAPYYSYEDNQTALHVIRDHFAKLLKDLPTPQEFTLKADHVRGHNMAKAAVEMLLWDYHSKRKGVPLVRELGPSKGYADVGISLGIDKKEVTRKRVEAAVERGYQRVKLKIERGKEFDIVKSVRDVFPDIVLSADANSCYRLKDAPAIKRLDRFGLVYLEQPLEHDDLLDHAKLAKEITTPICLDESVTSADRAAQAFDIGAAQVVNIKPGRVGGLGNSMEIAKIAKKHKGHVWIGGMFETGVGRSFNISLASSKLVDYPGDTSPNEKYFTRDIVKNPFTMTGGRIRPNKGPGVGIELDERYLEKVTVKSWKIF